MFLKFLFLLILFSSLFSNYIGSWVHLNNFPFGAILRDSSILLFIILSIINKNFYVWKRKDTPILVAYILLLFVVLTSFLNSDSLLLSFMGARVYILYTLLFLVLHKTGFIHHNNNFITYSLLLFFLIANIIGLIDFFSLGKFSSFLGYKAENLYSNLNLITSFENRIRLNGGFAGALDVGYFLTLGVALALNNILLQTKYRKLSVIVFILSVFSILFTLSRGAIFTLFVLIIFFIIFKFFKHVSKKLILSIILSTYVLFGYTVYKFDFFQTLYSRFTNSDISSRESSSTRLKMAINSIDYLAQNPEGVGLGTQGSGFLLSNKDNRLNTDNYFFWVALEIGIFGLLLNSIFYLLMIKRYIKNIYILQYLKLSLLFIFTVSALLSSSFISAIVLIYFISIFLLGKEHDISY